MGYTGEETVSRSLALNQKVGRLWLYGHVRLAVSETGAALTATMPSSNLPSVNSRAAKLVDNVSDREYVLAPGTTNTVGRRDPTTGLEPNIDLTSADPQSTISRRHAVIYHRDERFYLVEEIGAVNGTFVNSTRIKNGIPIELDDGDSIRLGLVRLTFHATGEQP